MFPNQELYLYFVWDNVYKFINQNMYRLLSTHISSSRKTYVQKVIYNENSETY
jgi:hypothetical protein